MLKTKVLLLYILLVLLAVCLLVSPALDHVTVQRGRQYDTGVQNFLFE